MLFIQFDRMLDEILRRIDEETARNIKSLSKEELEVFKYFLRNISVGKVIANDELRNFLKVANPMDVIKRLAEKGLLEVSKDSITIAKTIRDAIVFIIRERLERASSSKS